MCIRDSLWTVPGVGDVFDVFAGRHFMLQPMRTASQDVDAASTGDGAQPGLERASTLIGMADAMHDHQDILHRVFSVFRTPQVTTRDGCLLYTSRCV